MKSKGISKLNMMSFRSKLISVLILITIIPIIVLQTIGYYHSRKIIEDNAQKFVETNILQTKNMLNVVTSSYENILMQICTDEEIIGIIDNINNNIDKEININKLRIKLNGLCSSRPAIQAVSVTTETGTSVFYDKLSASSLQSTWINTVYYSYGSLAQNSNEPTFIPSKFATKIGDTSYYVFHMMHRFIDYKDIDRKIGTVILSIDADELTKVCSQENSDQSITFISDKYRNIVSYPDMKKIGRSLSYYHFEKSNSTEGFPAVLKENKQYVTDELEIYSGLSLRTTSLYDEQSGWTITNMYDETVIKNSFMQNQQTQLFLSALTFLVMFFVILKISIGLSKDITSIVQAIKKARAGNLKSRVEIKEDMSQEISVIGKQFNKMMINIDSLLKEVRDVTTKCKDAEITALEAQLNPHFLYNTLDTVNWIAIEHEDYQISNMISALAKILRYAVQNSNGIVTVREEIEWIRQYTSLQQNRIKSPFELKLNIDEDTYNFRVHKLLFQPFIENAFKHGFENINYPCFIEIDISIETRNYEKLKIVIKDNGKGMSKETIDKLNLQTESLTGGVHIGVNNSIARMKMYYGEQGSILLQSDKDRGTEITLILPKLNEKETETEVEKNESDSS